MEAIAEALWLLELLISLCHGRAFKKHLYAYTAGILKPHHHLRVSAEMRADLCGKFSCCINQCFADHLQILVCPIMQTPSKCILMLWKIQGYFGEFITKCDPCIEFLELYAVVVMVVNWIHHFENRRVVLYCNNESCVRMINWMTLSCGSCMVLIRILVPHGLIVVLAWHHSTVITVCGEGILIPVVIIKKVPDLRWNFWNFWNTIAA